jgi:hypothetical protein
MKKIIVSASKKFNDQNLLNETLDFFVSNEKKLKTIFLIPGDLIISELVINYARKRKISVKAISIHPLLQHQALNIQSDILAKEGHSCILFQMGNKGGIKTLETACKKYNKPVSFIRA